jgi:hypothetical protein
VSAQQLSNARHTGGGAPVHHQIGGLDDAVRTQGADLDCGGQRSATPLSVRVPASSESADAARVATGSRPA